jgi:Tol biopolymer transport system component
LGFSQYENPPSVKWQQIKTNDFVVVFPEEVKEKGIETAHILETIYKPVRNSLKISTPKTTVFLFNQSIISNGYSALVPRYMVFYSTPSQDANLVGGTDWLQTLAVHEYRHAVQFAKFDQNLTGFMGSLFGDYGRAILINFSVPLWVLEGDAVCTETVFSKEGRGRLPSFTRDIRALELENTRYSYYKAYLGSYKDYFPDYYHLGYLMTAYVRKNYGDETWNRILFRTTKFSFWPWTFSRSMKKYTRSSMKRTYMNCLNEFGSIWSDNIDNHPATYFSRMNPENKKVWTNYTYPFIISQDKILALKSGLADAPTLVILEDGQEKRLTEINPVDRVHSNGHLVVWSSETADIRWGERSYSDIMVYDLDAGSCRRITKKGKYFAPAVSPDGTLIAAISYGSSMKCLLSILDSKTGKETYNYEFPDDSFIRMPSWSEDGKKIVFTVSKGQERNISVLNISDNTIISISPFTTESITNPVFYKNFILYNSTVSGIDAIYAINYETNEIFNVVTGTYGSYNPSIVVDGKSLVFQDYTTMGNDIGLIDINTNKWKKVTQIQSGNDNYFQYLVDQEKSLNSFDSLPSDDSAVYKIKKYRPFLHSIDVHSCAPYPVNNGIGFAVFSNDKLNTTALSAGINYFPKDASHREFVDLMYSRYFPVFNFSFSYGRKYEVEEDTSKTNDYRKMNEKWLRTGVTLPFNFSRNIYTTNLSLNGAYNYIFYDFPLDYLFGPQVKKEVQSLELGIQFSNTMQMAMRDLNPRFGQLLTVLYWNTPFGSGINGERLVSNASLYFPGFLKSHSITLMGGYEKNSPEFREGIYKLTSSPEFVRGYHRALSDEFIKGTFVYSLPVAYPDLAIGPIIYCKRITTGLFYDYGQVKFFNHWSPYSSVGVDLNVNLNFFTFIFPLEIGLRTSYLLEDNSFAFEFILFGLAF